MKNIQEKTDWERLLYFLYQNLVLIGLLILGIMEKSWWLFLGAVIIVLVIKKNWITLRHRTIFFGSFLLFFSGVLIWNLLINKEAVVGAGGVFISFFIEFLVSLTVAIQVSILITPKKYRH